MIERVPLVAARELDRVEAGRLNVARGMFKVRVTVAHPTDAQRSFPEDFWVDTGALYSFVPEDRLEAIGIDASPSRELILADGRRELRRGPNDC